MILLTREGSASLSCKPAAVYPLFWFRTSVTVTKRRRDSKHGIWLTRPVFRSPGPRQTDDTADHSKFRSFYYLVFTTRV